MSASTTRYVPRHRADTDRAQAVRRVTLPGLLAAVGVSSVATGAPAQADDGSDHDGPTRQERIERGLRTALDQVGDGYQYGAEGPERFDCSGLGFFSFRQHGFQYVPRSSDAQARHMNRIGREDLRPGDFVFFYDGAAQAEDVYHVGIFTGWQDGRRQIVHSPSTGETVHRSTIWTDDWFAGTLRGL